MAESALAGGLDRGTTGDRYQVVVHVDAATLQHASTSSADAGQAVVELGDGGVGVSAETSQRLACDASIVVMRHGADGSVLDVGRKRRTIPPAIRRALEARDRQCQFPGCTARRCDAHHLVPWAAGGTTRLDGLLLLCRSHHRRLHEGQFRVLRDSSGSMMFIRPDGILLESTASQPPLGAPRDLAAAGIHVTAANLPRWNGEPLDLAWALDVLRGGG